MAALRVIVSYFFGAGNIPLGESCAAALESLGHEVQRFDSDPIHPLDRALLKPAGKIDRLLGHPCRGLLESSPWQAHHLRARLLEQAVRQARPDLLLVIRGNGFDPDFIRYLKRRYAIARTVCWWVKGPKWFELMHADAKGYDRYYCIHRNGYGEGDGIDHLPALAVDNLLYQKMPRQELRHPVVFVGSWNALRQQVVQGLTEFPVSIYGPKWRKKNLLRPGVRKMVRGSGIWGKSLCRLYNDADIALNISAWSTSEFTGLNLRILDVVGCGTFLLTDYSDDLRNYLIPGEEVETFRDQEELKDKLRFYLKNVEARQRIAERGYRKVCGMESYQGKMAGMLRDLGLLPDLARLQGEG